MPSPSFIDFDLQIEKQGEKYQAHVLGWLPKRARVGYRAGYPGRLLGR